MDTLEVTKIDKESFTIDRTALFIPSRGGGPVRWGPTEAEQVPDYGGGVIPASEFTDPALFEAEIPKALKNEWLIGCHGQQIPEAGDHFVWEQLGETVLIVRQQDGGVAAFHNVCVHRGARIVKASGCGAKSFSCPWHGFSYNQDGSLRGVREPESFEPGQLKGLRAKPVRTEMFGNFVWINLSESGPSLHEQMAELNSELSVYNLDNAQMAGTRTWEIQANWKTVIDGFLEVYHVADTHRTVDQSAFRFLQTGFTLFERNSMMVIPFLPTMDKLIATRDHQQFALCHYFKFPNVVFNGHAEHMELFTFLPVSPTKTNFVTWRLLQKGAPEHFYHHMDKMFATFCEVINEDLRVDAEAAATYRSSAMSDTITNRRECRVLHFHRNVQKAINS